MSDASTNSKAPLIIILLLILVGAGGYLFYSQQNTTTDVVVEDTTATTSAEISDEAESVESEGVASSGSLPFEPASQLTGALSTEDALAIRTLGEDSAPITIVEHSSFTCPHCANFHVSSFRELKTRYIDTGEVKLVFDDFPLNGPALDASMISRCVPQERYFGYVQFLFENQQQWAFDKNYINFLKQSSQLAGLSPEGFDECLANEELRQGLLDNVAKNQTENDVTSTPTFIFSNGKKISGSQPLPVFEGILSEISSAPAADATETEAAPVEGDVNTDQAAEESATDVEADTDATSDEATEETVDEDQPVAE